LFVYNVPTWTNTTSQLAFNVTLNSGKYGFILYDDVYGWYTTAATSFITVSKSGTYSVTTTQTSFNGGAVTVTGNNIGNGAVLKINGLTGTVVSRTATEAIFNIPALVTLITQTSFTLAKNKTIDLAKTTTWGDSPGW